MNNECDFVGRSYAEKSIFILKNFFLGQQFSLFTTSCRHCAQVQDRFCDNPIIALISSATDSFLSTNQNDHRTAMAKLTKHNTTSNDMLDSMAPVCSNYEMSGDSTSALSNGTNNHYTEYDVIEDDNDELNQLPLDADHAASSVPNQDMAQQQMVDVEIKENAFKANDVEEADEVLEDWQLLKVIHE